MKDILLEILVEEIPADFSKPAINSFKNIIEKTLTSNSIKFKSITSYITPRRLAL